MAFFTKQRQTLLFSATMPNKIQVMIHVMMIVT